MYRKRIFIHRQQTGVKVMFLQVCVCSQGEAAYGVDIHPRRPQDTWTWDTTGYGWQVGETRPIRTLSCFEIQKK